MHSGQGHTARIVGHHFSAFGMQAERARRETAPGGPIERSLLGRFEAGRPTHVMQIVHNARPLEVADAALAAGSAADVKTARKIAKAERLVGNYIKW